MLWFSNKPGRLSSLQEGSKKELDNFHLKPSLFSLQTHISIYWISTKQSKGNFTTAINSCRFFIFCLFLHVHLKLFFYIILIPSFLLWCHHQETQNKCLDSLENFINIEREISIISIFLSFACKRRTFANNECFFHFAQSMHELWIFCLFKMILSFHSSLSIFVTKSLTRRYDDIKMRFVFSLSYDFQFRINFHL